MDVKETQYHAPISKYLDAKARAAGLPITGTFELTPQCNLECKMCYVRKTPQQIAAHPRPLMTMEHWLEIAKQAKEAGMLNLLLTGGEPFLWPDFWPLYDELIKMGFIISINSNGTMIDEKIVERLKQNPPTRINITMYGANDETYLALCNRDKMFDRVNRAVTLLKEADIQVKLNCSLTPQNAHDLQAIVDYSKQKDVDVRVATYMFPPVRRDEDMIGQNERFSAEETSFYRLEVLRMQSSEESYLAFLKTCAEGIVPPPVLDESCVDLLDGKVLCGAGHSSFWITWDGYMTPCGMMTHPKADVANQNFNDAWNKTHQAILDMKLSGTCQSCKNQEVCHACAAMAYAETGTFEGIPKFLCEQTTTMQAIARRELAKRQPATV